MSTDTQLIFAMAGATESGRLHGLNDARPGQKFHGAFGAADGVGLAAADASLAPLRNMFVHGYLGALPRRGVVVDANGIVQPDPTGE